MVIQTESDSLQEESKTVDTPTVEPEKGSLEARLVEAQNSYNTKNEKFLSSTSPGRSRSSNPQSKGVREAKNNVTELQKAIRAANTGKFNDKDQEQLDKLNNLLKNSNAPEWSRELATYRESISKLEAKKEGNR